VHRRSRRQNLEPREKSGDTRLTFRAFEKMFALAVNTADPACPTRARSARCPSGAYSTIPPCRDVAGERQSAWRKPSDEAATVMHHPRNLAVVHSLAATSLATFLSNRNSPTADMQAVSGHFTYAMPELYRQASSENRVGAPRVVEEPARRDQAGSADPAPSLESGRSRVVLVDGQRRVGIAFAHARVRQTPALGAVRFRCPAAIKQARRGHLRDDRFRCDASRQIFVSFRRHGADCSMK